MRLATLKQIKEAARNVANEKTWNNTDGNFLVNQGFEIQDRLCKLYEPTRGGMSAWQNYDRKRQTLKEKLDICNNPELALC